MEIIHISNISIFKQTTRMAPNNGTTKVNHTSPQSTAKKAHVSNTERTNTCTARIKIILTFCLLAVFLDCLRSLSLGFLVIELMCSVALSIYLWFGKEKLVATRLHVDSINLKYLQQFFFRNWFQVVFRASYSVNSHWAAFFVCSNFGAKCCARIQ